MVLFLNACVRTNSRTEKLAKRLVARFEEEKGEEIKKIRLINASFPRVDQFFIDRRTQLINEGDYSDHTFDFAKKFAKADTIIIAAPFWDLSFPATLKQFFEQICVPGLTFRYTEGGGIEGLCKAKRIYFVCTAGGPIISEEYGYGYVAALARTFYGINELIPIKAEGLDIYGADVDKIMADAMAQIEALEI